MISVRVQIFPVGSFISNTYLPDGDMDVTGLFFNDENWFVKINELLCSTACAPSSSSLYGPPFL